MTAGAGTPPIQPFNFVQYGRRVHDGPCFVCAMLAGDPEYRHHLVYEDADAVAFLARFPTLIGYCLVAPKRHVENLIGDMEVDEYLAVQRVVYRVGRAVSEATPTERLYVLSLGSRDGNAHVHWHVAPLPPGVPYERQQYNALMAENGILDIDDERQRSLAAAIRQQLAQPTR